MISYRLSEDQPQKLSAGGVVLRNVNNHTKVAVLVRWPGGVRNVSDKPSYHLPKGTLESDETLEQAALREIREEAGLNAELKKYIGASVLPLRRELEPSYREG